MSKEGEFLIYCLEMYRMAKEMTGRQVIELFKQYDIIDYVMSCYEALHTTGWQYIVEDIDLFLDARFYGPKNQERLQQSLEHAQEGNLTLHDIIEE
jgi:hypothetical protein